MSKPIFTLLLACLPFIAIAQDCATMYEYFKEGVLLEYTSYGKKGKVESTSTQRVTRIEQSGDTLIAVLDLVIVSEKDKKSHQITMPMKCHEGTIYVDPRAVMPLQEASQTPDMQVEVSGTDMSFPPDLKPGQTLPDNTFEVSMRMNNIQVMKTQYSIKNRKVESAGDVTTPAGTYPCVKITHDFEYKLIGTRTNRIETWYNPTVGTVKSITYDKRGNEESRTELTKFSH